MTTATGRWSNALQVAEPDAITREEYRRLSGNGSAEAAAEAELAAVHRRAAVAEAARNRSEPQKRSPAAPGPATAGSATRPQRGSSPARSCEHCGATFTPTGHGGRPQVYCSPTCRHDAGLARRRARDVAKGSEASEVVASTGPTVSTSAVGPVGGNGQSAPFPSAGDGLAALVAELLALGAGDVEVELGHVRLTVHPRS